MNFLKRTVRKTSKLIRAHFSEYHITTLKLRSNKYVHQKVTTGQIQKRSFNVYFRNLGVIGRFLGTDSSYAVKCKGLRYPNSKTAAAMLKSTGRIPFACTLRPNLTAGAFPRTAGGYGIGGGCYGSARYFSHTPTPPAQVIQNVSAAFRILWLSDKKNKANIQIPTMDMKSVSRENTASSRSRNNPMHLFGSYIDFNIKPTLISFSNPTENILNMNGSGKNQIHLNIIGFLKDLSSDFSRNTDDLSAIMNDIKRLSLLGDLPITLEDCSVIRVHFPGHDFEYVERLCDDLGIQRGIVHQNGDTNRDGDDEISLVFPYAPNSGTIVSSTSDLWSQSQGSIKFQEFDEDSLLDHNESALEGRVEISNSQISREEYCSSNYEGIEGI
ncbi:hypothetical protein EPUL_001056 [Erysiphe pulchra]|uniref:Uncharacterized protein n=1 Tax=Erysiphe pulchra TaxID=225359 RepID=A0A2S4Q0Y8_9PEZI|nr:hypothetical protein EPUL_001056 [Erysiphe pulchra]